MKIVHYVESRKSRKKTHVVQLNFKLNFTSLKAMFGPRQITLFRRIFIQYTTIISLIQCNYSALLYNVYENLRNKRNIPYLIKNQLCNKWSQKCLFAPPPIINYIWLSTKQFVCVSHHSQFSQYYDMFKVKIKLKIYPFSYVMQYSKLLQSTNVKKKVEIIKIKR